MTDELEARIRVIEEEVARLGGLLTDTMTALKASLDVLSVVKQQIATHDAVIARVEQNATDAIARLDARMDDARYT
jgi:hypothetical protein